MGTHNGGNGSSSLTDTTKNFISLGVEQDRLVRNVTDGSHGIITSFSTDTNPNDTINFSGGLTGGTDNDWDDADIYEIDGVMDTTVSLAFPDGYEFIWGGPTSGLYTTADRYDKDSYYKFFRVKT